MIRLSGVNDWPMETWLWTKRCQHLLSDEVVTQCHARSGAQLRKGRPPAGIGQQLA